MSFNRRVPSRRTKHPILIGLAAFALVLALILAGYIVLGVIFTFLWNIIAVSFGFQTINWIAGTAIVVVLSLIGRLLRG